MRILALFLPFLLTLVASADPNKENGNSSLPVVGEKFELSFFHSLYGIDGKRTVKTVVKVGEPFEEKLILADDAYLKIKGTLRHAVDGEYPITLSYEDKKAGYNSRNYERDLKLTPGKAKTWTVGSGVVFIYSAIITRIPNPDSQKSEDIDIPDARNTTTGIEFAAELPPGAQIKREDLTWGKEVDGLQLGIRLDYLNRPYAIGEKAAFTLAVRNVGKESVRLTYYKPDWSIKPEVTDEKGGPLSIFQQMALFGPAYSLQVHSVSTIVAPNQIFEVASASLLIGPSTLKQGLEPALDVTPGKYRVRYEYNFDQNSNADKPQTIKSWGGKLSSGVIMLDVVEAQKEPVN